MDFYTPNALARKLGLSTAQLRKYAAAYEALAGPLPRNNRGRLYDRDAARLIETARELVRRRLAEDVPAAVRRALEGTEPPPEEVADDAVSALVEELRVTKQRLLNLERVLVEIKYELRGLRADLRRAGTGKAR